ncbi:MAG: protein kinase [Lentisphaeria bacterium]|nr:protein kinase [Lentisphaeria bacterium]
MESGEFNRTVVVTKPERRKRKDSTPLRKVAAAFGQKKQDVDDIIGGLNVSRYTDVELDTSAKLNTPLSTLSTRYSVLEQFAQGGHATVSIAQDKNLRRIVAIKSLNDEAKTHSELVDSFVSEAKVTAQLDHPSIIPVYGLTGDSENGFHLSMKLVNGKTLRDYLRNLTLNYRIKGIQTFDEDVMLRKRLEIFLRVCDAISYAHHRNVMHRDLKPENIMLGEFMEVFVMDWGLAKLIPKKDDIPDPTAPLSGTPRYFSPEALRGDRCDARSDLFTLGLILQEIVTLQFAVKGKDEKEYMEHIISGELEPIEHLFGRRIDRALKAIIKKATAYQMEDRYQTVAELAEDLRRYMGGLPVTAYPDDFFMRLTRYTYKHRKGFAVVIMALLFCSAAITAVAVFRQLQTTKEMTMQRRAMNFIYNRTATVAEHLDITALQIQEELSALARISAYLLTFNNKTTEADADKAFHPAMDKLEKDEPGMFLSPYYKRKISLDYGIYTAAPNADAAKCALFKRKISPMLTKMKYLVLGSKSNFYYDEKDYDKLKIDYLNQGFPIRAVFVGSRDGIKLLYPWRGNYSRNIDPRERDWYKDAVNKPAPVWGKPYMDIDSVAGLSLPCSVEIRDLNGNFYGVAGLDVSVNRLTQSILTRGNVGDYVIDKAVINLKGETVFSTNSKFFNQKFDPSKFHQDTMFQSPLYGSPRVRVRILKSGKSYGIFTIDENGRKIVYSYAHLEILNMYYVVSADYEKLLAHVKKQQDQ